MAPPSPSISRRHFLATGAMIGTTGVAGCSTLLGSSDETMADWPAFGYDARNTGYVRDETAPPDNPIRLWTYETAFRNAGPAAVSTERVFHVIGHRLYAINRLDGTVQWKTTVGTWGSEPPILVDGTVYLGWSGGVRAIDAMSGESEWTFDVSGGVFASPGYYDGTVIVGRNAGRGAGAVLGLRNGNEDWRFEIEAGTTGGLTVVDGTAYVGTRAQPGAGNQSEDVSDLESVFAIATDDGSEEWTFPDVTDDVSVPAVEDGRVFVGCADDHVYAINAATGDREWMTAVPLIATSSPVVVKGVVYIGSTDGHVYAINAETGEITYRVDVGAPIKRGISVVDEVNEDSKYEGWRQRLVYAGTEEGTVVVVKTESEDVLSSVSLEAPVEGPPFVRDRLLHVATADGNVHVLGE